MSTDDGVALYSPEFFADPYSWYGRLRETDPVHWHAGQQMWILTREVDAVHRREFIQLDPPDHTGKRAQVSARFAPRALEPLRAAVAGVVGELLDAVAGGTGMDVLRDVAKPLPLLVISRLMGIPAVDVAAIAERAQRRMAGVLSLADDRLQVATAGFRETTEYLGPALDARRPGCPVTGAGVPDDPWGLPSGDDVLGDMAAAESAGAWSREESLANAMMIVDAGHETTIQLICNSTLALLRHPEQWERLLADPRGVAASAVDEALRFDRPLHALRRIVVEDVELEGRTLQRGDRVLAVVAAANRDPRRVPDPERLDVLRRPNAHPSLGAGAHFCLGQHLANVEAQEYSSHWRPASRRRNPRPPVRSPPPPCHACAARRPCRSPGDRPGLTPGRPPGPRPARSRRSRRPG